MYIMFEIKLGFHRENGDRRKAEVFKILILTLLILKLLKKKII